MFRSIKKRKKDAQIRRVIRTTDEDDNESSDDVSRKGKDNDDDVEGDDDDDDNGDGNASKQSRKRMKKEKKKKQKSKKRDIDSKRLRQPPPSSFFLDIEDLDGGGDGEDRHIMPTQKLGKKTGLKIHDDIDDDQAFGFEAGASHEVENEDENHLTQKMNKKYRFPVSGDILEASAVRNAAPSSTTAAATTPTGISYGKDALEALKKQQKIRQQPSTPEAEMKDSPLQEQHIASSIKSESFIPLYGDAAAGTATAATIIAGDEAIEHTMMSKIDNMEVKPGTKITRAGMTNSTQIPHRRQQDEHFPSDANNADEGENRAWEAQVSRRALGGGRGANLGRPYKSSSSNLSSSSKTFSSRLLSLDNLQHQLESTLGTLQTQQEEIHNTINRRVADLEHATIEYNEHCESLVKTGKSLEEYQKLRNDLILWCGGLRDLQRKVRPIVDGYQSMILHQLDEVGLEFQSLQDDSIAILNENGLIEKVLGRQAEFPTNESTLVVDEFGRDVKSQYLLDRDERMKQREDRLFTSETTASQQHIDAKAFVQILCEDGNEMERSGLLQEALKTALQDLDPTYTAEHNLLELFQQWKATYPEDYIQCYADLSLGDLASVLLQVRFCESAWLPGMLSTLEDVKDVEYPSDLEPLVSDQFPPKAAARCIQKGLLPFLLKILEVVYPSGIFLSKAKSMLFSRVLQEVIRSLDVSSGLRKTLKDKCRKTIYKCLDSLAIPVCRRSNKERVAEISGDSYLSQKYALSYQAMLVSKVLSNTIRCFSKVMIQDSGDDGDKGDDEQGIALVFNFINDKFLMMLSSMEQESAKEAFQPVYETIVNEGQLMQSPSLFLASMPLRGAAQAYGIPNM